METVKYQWCPGFKEEGGMNRQSMDNLWGCETILYNIIMVGTGYYIFVKPI